MLTKILKIDPLNPEEKEIKYAAKILRKGGLVAFPTETVYGLGANALDKTAVKKIYEAKGRPNDNPLIVHISNIEEVNDLVQEVPNSAKKLMKNFWPGPLTIIMKKSNLISDTISAGLDTVAIRFPANKIAGKLIETSGLPIAAPSANISGKPSPTEVEHVIDDLMGKVDIIIDGGKSIVGLESTVIDLTSGQATILRPGGITYEQIYDTLGNVRIDSKPIITSKSPKSPGMKYRHYSPNADVVVVEGQEEDIIKIINKKTQENKNKGLKVGILATDETANKYQGQHIISAGSRKTPEVIASNLFSILRKFDKLGMDIIFIQSVNEDGIGRAIKNRIYKASGGKILKV